jgi:glycosyltransferase involved in cell wall biosynthesis
VKSLFLSHQNALKPGGGGQQHCTSEYHQTFEAAGFELVDVTFDTDRSFMTRLRRKLRPAVYANLVPANYFTQVAEAINEQQPSIIFCNTYDLVPFARRLKNQVSSQTRLVLLSHGLASVDAIHAARVRRNGTDCGYSKPVPERWIGKMIHVETESLPYFDHVFCLASFETEICRWLGARSVSWLPRMIPNKQVLTWNPTGNRIGCVGTFDHPPNLEGLVKFCQALQVLETNGLRLRVVTRSHAVAADLRAHYSFVDDLGSLEDTNALEAEAATWSAFVHPLFCYAMGCSTKIAIAFSWGLPVLTTTAGLRGYTWSEGNLPLFNSPSEMANAALAALDLSRAIAMRDEVMKAARSTPSLTEVAVQIRRDLSVL